MTPREFERLVRAAARSLPAQYRRRLDNVAIIVRARPSRAERAAAKIGPGQTLLGLYTGTPLAERGSGYSFALPDRIFLYREPLLATAHTRRGLVAQIEATLRHEIAHHFGISDERLDELGLD